MIAALRRLGSNEHSELSKEMAAFGIDSGGRVSLALAPAIKERIHALQAEAQGARVQRERLSTSVRGGAAGFF